jgi:hypothetical protein
MQRGAGAEVSRASLYCGHCRRVIRGSGWAAIKRAHAHVEKTGHVVYGSLLCLDGSIEQVQLKENAGAVVPDATGYSYDDGKHWGRNVGR